MKIQKKKLVGGVEGGGEGGGVRLREGQGGCDRRIEVFGKIQEKKLGGGVGSGGGGGVGLVGGGSRWM